MSSESSVIQRVEKSLEWVISNSVRRDELASTFASGGYAALARDSDQIVELINEIAPEHLELLVDNYQLIAPHVINAGVIFCGPMVPASIGDYFAGPSHVLPTNRTAKFAGALSVLDFTKETSLVMVENDGYEPIADIVGTIADCEGLTAHSRSVGIRLSSVRGQP